MQNLARQLGGWFIPALLASATLAAPVSWTGLGDGTRWSDPANWSGNALPGPADDVTISVPGSDPEILITGVSPTILSLTTSETLRIATGATLSVQGAAASSAAVRVAGGTIAGGAWSFSGAGFLQAVGTAESRLNNAAISGDIIATDANARIRLNTATIFTALRLRASNSSAAFDPGYVLTGQIIVDAAASAHIDVTAAGTFTIAPGGVVAIAPGLPATLDLGPGWWYNPDVSLVVEGVIANAGTSSLTVDPAALSVAPGGRIENTGAGSITAGVRRTPFSWNNAGTLRASAGTLTATDALTNSGTIDILGTGRVNLTEGWSNPGTVQLAGSARLDLGGSFTTAALGTITRSGPSTTVNVTGQWNNTASTFAFTAATGSYTMLGGTITGGTLTTAGGAGLSMGNATNTLTGVAYGGEIVCDGGNSRVRFGAGTSALGLRLRGVNGGASFPPGFVIGFPIVVEGSGSLGTIGLDTTGPGTLTLGPAASITAAGNWTGTLSLGPSWWDTACAFINQGAISLGGSGRTLSLGGTGFTNAAGGSIAASAGVTVNADVQGVDAAAWSSAGAFSVTDGTLNLRDQWSFSADATVSNTIVNMDGVFAGASALRLQRSGGTVNLVGRLSNAGQTTTLGPTSGSWRLAGGTITGGTLATTASETLIPTGSGGTLDSVALTRELAFNAATGSGRLRITGSTTLPSLRLRGESAGVSFGPGYTINFPIISESAVLTVHGVDCTAPGATLTVGPGGSFTSAAGSLATMLIGDGWWGVQVGTLINQGTIECSALNRELRITPATGFANPGTVRVRNGADASITGLSGPVSGFDIADSGTTLALSGGYTLAGSLSVGPGTTATLRGVWANSGAIAIDHGTLQLDGTFSLANLGAFTNAGGAVSILGTLSNPTSLTLNAATGSWTLAGGSIVGGTISQTQGARLLFAPSSLSTLTDVSFTEEVQLLNPGSRVRIRGSTTAPSWRLSGNSTSLGFAPGRTLNEPVFSEGAGSKGVETDGDGTLTIGPGCTIRCTGGTTFLGNGFFTGNRTVTVLGTLEADGPTNLTIDPTILTNLDAAGALTGGTYRALNAATLAFPAPVLRNNASITLTGAGGSSTSFDAMTENAGTLTLGGGRDLVALASGNAGTAFTNSGVLTLGPGSRFTLGTSGRPVSFTQTPAGRVEFELAGTDLNTHGSLRINGPATLDGTVAARYVDGFPRQCGQIFEVLDANSRTGQFAALDLPPVDDSTLFLLFYGGADARFSVSARADFNQDGFLDFFDYDDFVACFEGTACPPGISADFNNDEFVDFFDYDDFVFRFEAGC